MVNIATFITSNNQVQQSLPSNPGGTTSTAAQVMMGLAIAFTPKYSGKVSVFWNANVANNTINDGAGWNTRFGTGTAPINGAAVTGTRIEGNGAINLTGELAANNFNPAYGGGLIVSALTVGTTYWFDISMSAITGGTATLTGITFNITEFTLGT